MAVCCRSMAKAAESPKKARPIQEALLEHDMTQLAKKASLHYISPALMDFDTSNPRFGGQLKTTSQPDIQKRLMAEPYFAAELIDSLLANGFIDYEPLVVRRKGDRYIVIEGNRRLAAIREIEQHPELYQGRTEDLKEIPVLVFPEQPDAQQKNEMRVYLGVRHLLGFREWPPLSKAQFLDRESKTPGGLDGVIKEMRITKSQARRFLVPFRLLIDAKLEIPKGEDFWVLGEALQRSGIKKFVQLEVDSGTLEIVGYSKKNLNLLLDDLYGPEKSDGTRDAGKKVVGETRELSRLSKVLGSEKAAAALRAGKTLEEAEIYVDTREESLRRLEKVANELGVVVKKVTAGRKDDASKKLNSAANALGVAASKFLSNELL